MSTVVGIFPNHDAVSNLAFALKSGGFDSRDLTVISRDGAIGYLRSTDATFIRKTAQLREEAATPATRMHGVGQTAWDVPGNELEDPPEDYSSAPELEALSELSVPDGRTDAYTRAIDAGRWVVGYTAGERAAAIQSLFLANGGTPVDVF
jgi:hypothetical protein